MSTLDVACARCDKRFRVRAEFAGKSTRCPGCSAPITIGGSAPAPPSRPERPVPRPRPRDDEDTRPRRPAGDWRPVDSALGREQTAVVFAFATVPCSFIAYCLGRASRAAAGADAGMMVFTLLLVVGPTLVAGAFGAAARVAALRTPPETGTRATAVASLLCAVAGLLSVLVFGLTLLARLDGPGASGFVPVVATVGLVVSGLGAVGTFAGFVAQVGIARRSAAVSAAVGRAAVTACVAVLIVTGLGLLLALAIEAAANPYSGSHEEEAIAAVLFGVLIPMGFAAVLIAYHRLLAAARRALVEEPAGRSEP